MTFSVPGYRVEHLLGYGSQSQVWAARALDTGERVAIKRIAVDSPAAARATRAEAALLAALNHPSLIGLRGYLALGAEVALVMELAEAGSLADLLRRRGRLSPAEVVATISPIAAALAHAHDEGVLHADVSAANVLFTAAGQPKLADLGIARLLAGPAAGLGTPAYLDPVLAAGGAAGPASDVFALAAVALHALTGAGPWQRPGEPSGTAEQVLATAATGQILDLAGRLAEASPELAEVLARALNIEPHRRGTAAELALDLRAAVRPVPVVLAGGRIQSSVGRHSVELRERDRAAQRGSSDGGAEGAQGFPPADLTHVARPRVRASVEPEPVARRRWPSRTDRRLVRGGRWLSPAAAGAGVLLAISGLAVAGGVVRLAQHRDGRAIEPA
ncbi:MAG: serine/threonine-protein kinase, partial [Jatrophihabitantaceae bacterium]